LWLAQREALVFAAAVSVNKKEIKATLAGTPHLQKRPHRRRRGLIERRAPTSAIGHRRLHLQIHQGTAVK
jgi:hypothetical protein